MKIEKGKMKAEAGRPADLEERLLEFSVRIGKVVDALPDTRLGRHIAGQLVRCGTSPGANYSEACVAESKRDFIHKLGVTLKELRESRHWIRIVMRGELLTTARMNPILDEVDQLVRIVAKSIVTAKANRNKSPERSISI